MSMPIQTVRLLPANRDTSSTDSSPTSAATSLPLSAPLRLPPELTNNSKFAFAFPDVDPGATSLPLIPPVEEVAETDTRADPDTADQAQDSPPSPSTDMPGATPLPRLARAFSMPVASQLGHLRHPRRPPGFGSPGSSSYGNNSVPYTPGLSTIYSAPNSAIPQDYIANRENPLPFSGLSLELADTAQLIIQTLLQLSPPHLLDPAHEQFSACTLQLPTTSVGAMLTAMKGLNWMSVRLPGFVEAENTGLESVVEEDKGEEVFDVGEMLQNVGDVLAGIAAQAGIDVVIYHADVTLKHVGVKGEEGGVSYVLSHIVRQIIAIAEPGDTIELGLQLDTKGGDTSICLFDIIHRLGTSDPTQPPQLEQRLAPQFDTVILRRLLTHIRATLQVKPAPVPSSPSLTATTTTPSSLVAPSPTLAYTLSIPFKSSPVQLTPPELSPADEAERQPFPTLKLAREPTLEELSKFAETQLRGKHATFYASPNSSFAHHLTSYLTAWGMNVEHKGVGVGEEAAKDELKPTALDSEVSSENTAHTGEDALSGSGPVPNSSFIIIDDDVSLLRKRLLQIRAETSPAISTSVASRKRPSLAANHRPRSSPQIRQLIGIPEAPAAAGSGAVVVHFTSLANFKVVRDTVQSVLFSSPGCGPWPGMTMMSGWGIPEVLVIPKPAGPRRFLTALHTAVTKPMIDPVFSPIATSPLSPSAHSSASLPNSHSHRSSPAGGKLQPSPLAIESREYFSETAEMVLASPENATTGAGVVLQDLEGRPAGILFQPKARPSPTAVSSSPPTAPRVQLGNGLGQRRGLTIDGVMRAASPTGVSGVRKSAPPSPTTPLSAGVIVSARRVSADSTIGGTGTGSGANGTPARAPGSNSVASSVAATPAATTILQPAFIRTKSGGRPGVTGRSRQNSGNKLDMVAVSASAEDGPTKKEITVSRRQSGASDGVPKKPDGGVPRRRGSGVDGKSPGVAGVGTPGKAGLKKGKGKDIGIAPPISVLIVEDNPINQTILSTFIKRKKIKCEVAQNGLQAVEKWKTGRFHLIFMDIQMPVMDGIEATREIRRLEKVQHFNTVPTPPIESPSVLAETKQLFNPPSDSTKLFMSGPSSPFRSSVVIVALTASNLQSDRVTALAAGCNDFLTKPVALDWLDKKIIEWGSIKALQMWADPEMAKLFQRGQDAKAKAVATQLRIERTPSRARKASQDEGGGPKSGVQITVQAPTPSGSLPTPVPVKPPLSRSMTKSPSPLSHSMVLPSEPPPPPAPTEMETPVAVAVAGKGDGEVVSGNGVLDAVDCALEKHLAETKQDAGGLSDVPGVSNEGGAKPKEEEGLVENVPGLVLDPPTAPTAPSTETVAPPTTPPEIKTTQPSAIPPPPAPDMSIIPVSPSILTDTPYLSANSIPSSPHDPSS
ncbi:ssk1 response regulator receiver [Ceratobasidium sp. 395]|nr:ssk1 response regulator receiver [Ceratobasidium sp. 395]